MYEKSARACRRFARYFKWRLALYLRRTVQQLLERTILQGEGNSLLIIGPRGSGKTWVRVPPLSVEEIMQRSMQVVNKVFHALQRDKRCRGNYIKVYLNGQWSSQTPPPLSAWRAGMVHTNDRLALLEIARQFNTDSNAGENVHIGVSLTKIHVFLHSSCADVVFSSTGLLAVCSEIRCGISGCGLV